MKKTITMLVLLCVAAFAQQNGSFTDTRDKKTYKTVKIGNQTWMAENLNYNAKDSKCYDNKPANCEKYGRLYSRETAKSVCPTGWHLPTREEWDVLYNAAGGEETAEKVLKSKSGWNDDIDFLSGSGKKISGNGEDKFGFAALPGGTYGYGGECEDEDCSPNFGYGGSGGFFASITYYINICSNHNGPSCYGPYNGAVPELLSVRCLQDDANYVAKAAELKNNRGTFTDTRDKKNYKTIKIGSQTWMAENLNYNAKDSKCYDNKESNCKEYGRIYNWGTAINSCPNGWHLPSNEEWQTLVNFVGGDKIAREKLVAIHNGGKDDYGFSALWVGNLGYWWWSSSESKSNYAYKRSVDSYDAYYNSDDKCSLFSVRCLQGETGTREKAIIAKLEAATKALKTNRGTFTDSLSVCVAAAIEAESLRLQNAEAKRIQDSMADADAKEKRK